MDKMVEMTDAQIKQTMASKNLKILDESIKLCYVVISNTTRVRFKNGKQEKDEFTQILRACKTEENAHAYVKKLPVVMNRSYHVIPTPYGDIELPKEDKKNETK